MHYLTDRFERAQRRLIVIAALVLVPVFFLPVLPIWQIKLWAPQYREGLTLTIYANTIKGDLQNINLLNHYVGMHAIHPDEFQEFRFMPQALTAFGLLALVAFLVNRRWLAILGWLVFTGFAIYMFGDYASWLHRYGHDLDPRAPIKLPGFGPPLIGFKHMANFKVLSLPGPGTLLLGVAWLLGPLAILLEMRDASRARRPSPGAAGVLVAALLAAAAPATASVWRAAPGGAVEALAAAAPGDTVVLARGVHPGPLLVRRAIVLRGDPGAVVDGARAASALEIAASGTRVEDLSVHGSGRDIMRVDSGIHVIACADVTLRRLHIAGTLYGVYGERADRLALEDCELEGTVEPRNETGNGNGIHLWYCEGARIVRCRVSRFLDAVYLSFANHVQVEDSEFADCGRYGFHTMYCQSGRLSGNRFTRNVAGCAIMFSNLLRIENNDFAHNRGSRTYGLLLRDCSDGEFRDNRLVDNTVGAFLDNSNRNRFRRNVFQDNGWGVLLFSSCARDTFAENDFLHNDYPVALDMPRTDNRFDDGRAGNYWSDNAPYDLDANGVSDVPYSPVTAFAFVSKQYPDLTILAKSPAVAALGVAERVFPSLQPSDAVDRAPLVAPVRVGAAASPRGGARREAAWGACAAFAGVGLLGVAGVARGRSTWR